MHCGSSLHGYLMQPDILSATFIEPVFHYNVRPGAFETRDLDCSILFSADIPQRVKILTACK